MIGDTLRAEREKQNLTVHDVEKGTSIRALYIESIEAGDYSKLPGEVYTKGFIRNYANFLKMDASAMVKRYMEENHPDVVAAAETAKEQAAQQSQSDAMPASSVRQQAPSAPKVRPSGSGYATGEDFRQRVESSHKKQNMLLVAAVVLAVAGGAYYLMSSDDSAATKKPAATTTQQAKAPQQEAAKPEAKKADGVELAAKFTDRCWTQVTVDGKTVYEGTMEKGKSETWKGKEKIVITAGNADAIEVTLNQQSLGKLGAKGQVVEKTYTPDGPVADADAKDNKDSKK
ncbi:MAG: DUF4115 domain-containing protein [Selenomonas sp.]|jgi:cytoskeletal protein RodZ|nr:DUF4115 domain-containing protein [Selenomonas sp.]